MKIDSEKIEKNLSNSILEFTERIEIQSQMSEAFHIWNNDSYSISEYTADEDIPDETYAKFLDWFIYDFKTFNNKKRVIEEFYENNLDDLKEEERTVLKDWIKSYQSYFEVVKINSGVFCIIKDLFTGEEHLVYDKIISSKIRSVDIISARLLKTGDTIYFSGIISIYPNLFKQIIKDYFKKEFDIYNAENSVNDSVARFLKDNGYLIANYLDDVINHPQLVSLEGDEFLIATAEYNFNENKPVLKILNESDELTYVNNTLDKNDYFFIDEIEGIEVGANIEISSKAMTITTNTKNKLTTAKSFIESVLEDFITHNNDSSKKLNSYIESSKKKSYELPRGFKSKKKFESELDDFYKNWIDKPLEALRGITPREALKTPEGRKELEYILIELEKLYDSARKAGEPYYEVYKLREILQNSLN
ncbi:MAG: hypothetical protein ACR2NW_07800 [Thermodesulfobacteriota bacterium]